MKQRFFSLILFARLPDNGACRCWIVITVADKSSDRRRPQPRSMATMARSRVESRSELTSLPCKVAFRAVFPKNSQPTTQPTVWYVLYDCAAFGSPHVL